MRALLVTSWGTICGIASHSAQLIQAVQAADPTIEILVGQNVAGFDRLDPRAYNWPSLADYYDVVHLNYHAALHSLFTPAIVQDIIEAGCKVVITYHDSGVPNSEQCLALYQRAAAFVVHEPAQDLPQAHYWRMGVPEWDGTFSSRPRGWTQRPFLGTVGFNFGWKAWPELAKRTAVVGWGFIVCTPEMTEQEEADLRQMNPWVDVRRGYDDQQVLGVLRDCTATAFCNVTHNTGQSAAILMGIAAKKPLIALETCRQYRSLLADELGNRVITWCESFEEVQVALTMLQPARFDTGICALAEQDSWKTLGAKYASLYRSLVV